MSGIEQRSPDAWVASDVAEPAARATTSTPHTADREAPPARPVTVVLRPNPATASPVGAEAPAAPVPTPTRRRAQRTAKGAEPAAPAPVVVRIGRVELVALPATALASQPEAHQPSATPVGHPDLLAAHRHHNAGGWPR
ncbi:hypothetical protein AB0O75_05445 [Streptomyces sp. NPDC088921]|uniref:hypothetical protein n=1 Tax=unclassified Streptomyces TaxID=2593676 RepID=UPI00343A8439